MDKEQRGMTSPLRGIQGETKRFFVVLAFLGISIALAYVNSLNGTWAMDDVLANKPVGINNIRDFLGFRKVAYFTFLLNQGIAPFSRVSFRLFNLLIHLLNSLLVYLLAYKTIYSYPVSSGARGRHIAAAGNGNDGTERLAFYGAFLSSTVFALHPININAVSYIVQRMASLATLFVLLSLLSYRAAWLSEDKVKSVVCYGMCTVFILFGIFSKENAVMAVPLMLLYDYVFLSGFGHRVFMKKAFVIAGVGIVSIGSASYFLGFHQAIIDMIKIQGNPNLPLSGKGWMAIDVYWTPLQHILTEFRVVSRYLLLLVVPLPQFLVFDWWGFPVSEGIIEPTTTLPSLLFIVSLLLFSLLKMKRFPFLCFGILWYIIAVSLESFFAVGADLYFEHRNYLPVSGLFIGIFGQIVMSFQGRMREKTVWRTAIILSVIFGSLTFARNFVWKDSVTLWEDTLKKNPSNIRAMIALGNAYLMLADMEDAGRYYQDAVQMSSNDKRIGFLNESAYSLGMLYLFKGEAAQAKRLIDAFSDDGTSYRPKILKGFYKALNNDREGALREYREIIDKTSAMDRVVVYTLMGDTYRKGGQWDDAIQHYQKAISLDSGFSAAYYGAGASYLGKKDISMAEEYFQKTLSLDPHNVLALSDMADLLLIKKANPQDAFAYAERAVAKSPPFYQPYMTTGIILVVLGREHEADGLFNKALEKGMPAYLLSFSKARAYYLKGDAEKTDYYLSELNKYKDLPRELKEVAR